MNYDLSEITWYYLLLNKNSVNVYIDGVKYSIDYSAVQTQTALATFNIHNNIENTLSLKLNTVSQNKNNRYYEFNLNSKFFKNININRIQLENQNPDIKTDPQYNVLWAMCCTEAKPGWCTGSLPDRFKGGLNCSKLVSEVCEAEQTSNAPLCACVGTNYCDYNCRLISAYKDSSIISNPPSCPPLGANITHTSSGVTTTSTNMQVGNDRQNLTLFSKKNTDNLDSTGKNFNIYIYLIIIIIIIIIIILMIFYIFLQKK
jgi:hypothetical protein